MQEIHDYLKRLPKTATGHDPFILVWSEKFLEKRYGTYCDYTEEGVFLREVTELREVKKLNYVTNRWILAKFLSAEQAFNPVIPESMMGAYEPFWVFEDKNGKFQAPYLKVVEFLVNMASGNHRIMNPTERKTLAELTEAKEVQDFMDALDCSPVASLLHTREAIVVP